MPNQQRWRVEWSSATASGNAKVEYPDHLTRAQVWQRWEAAHKGCNIDRMTSCGGGRYEEAKDDERDPEVLDAENNHG